MSGGRLRARAARAQGGRGAHGARWPRRAFWLRATTLACLRLTALSSMCTSHSGALRAESVRRTALQCGEQRAPTPPLARAPSKEHRRVGRQRHGGRIRLQRAKHAKLHGPRRAARRRSERASNGAEATGNCAQRVCDTSSLRPPSELIRHVKVPPRHISLRASLAALRRVMFRLAGCARGGALARLAPGKAAPAALRAPGAMGRAPFRELSVVASGTDVRFKIPGRDEQIVTIDEEEIVQRRDQSYATRLVQVRLRGAALRSQPARARCRARRCSRAAAQPRDAMRTAMRTAMAPLRIARPPP